jgi:hypothetical protein
MGVMTFPVVSGAQIISMGDSSAKHEPGTVMAFRNSTNSGWSIVQYVLNGNTVIDQACVAVPNLATLSAAGVTLAATTDGGAPPAGVAAATIGSLRFGWIYIHGYVEKAEVSHTAAAGEYLITSASTAGKMSPNFASVFNQATLGTTASGFQVWGVSRAALATGIGSINILGWWGV